MRHDRGRTLLELLMAFVGFTLVSAVVITVTITMYKALAMVRAKAVVSDTLRTAMEQVGRDAQAAKGALPGPCASYSATSNSAISKTLILDNSGGGRTVYACASGSCDTTTPGKLQTIVYGNSACTVVTTPLRTLAQEVTALNFDTSQDLGRRVVVQLGRQSREPSSNYTYSAELTGTFRWRSPPS